MPAATAEKIRERSCSTIQRLLTSYVRRKRGISGVTSESPAGAAPTAAVPHDPAPSGMPRTCPRDPDGLDTRNMDVTMAENTFSFGNTMCMDDLGGGAVTPPQKS
ncbi:unnamed protein product [Peronospora destructor]|nr:unnamed protein product [Peronospora destructor]